MFIVPRCQSDFCLSRCPQAPGLYVSLVAQVRTLPASQCHKTVFVRVCVCVCPSVTMEGRCVTDHPWSRPSGRENMNGCERCSGYTLQMQRAPGPQALTNIATFLSTPPSSSLPVSSLQTRWGARVTSDPPPHSDWWDSPAPPPLYCTLMGIWHDLGPFIRTPTGTHLSFLISLPISVVPSATHFTNSATLSQGWDHSFVMWHLSFIIMLTFNALGNRKQMTCS